VITGKKVSDIFGSMVFDDRVMKATLSAKVYASLKKTIDEGAELDLSVANAVAEAMKDWAISKGATHFTHWFQPLTGITAEKHDTFIAPSPDGGFAQWNDIKAYYRDYAGDTADRKTSGWGKEKYNDSTGRNDFVELKVCEDADNLYFFAMTSDDITAAEGNNWMNLFIGIDGSPASSTWNGYQFVVNYKAPDKEGYLYLGALSACSEYSVTPLSEVRYRIYKNILMLSIPKSVLGIDGPASILFKWADNCTSGDVCAFYTTGDAALIEMMGLIGMGNNPMVGATVAVAVAVEEAMK